MKTINDIIEYVVNADYGCERATCKGCIKYKWCYIENILCALDYLYKGEY